MPLRPNIIERRLIRSGAIPSLMLDGAANQWGGQALVAAMETGVFNAVRESPRTVEEIADATGSAQRGVEMLVRALVPFGYLEEASSGPTPRYRLTEAADRSLPEEDLDLIGAFFREQAKRGFDAAEAVRKAPEDGIVGWELVQDGEVGRGYQATMRWLASDMVEPVVSSLELPDGAQRMIDIGGSHGLYTVAFCEKHPQLEGRILDWPIGLEEAQRTLDERPDVADRIELVEGDFEEDDELPGGNDLVMLGNIVHGLDEAGARELFAKIGEASTDRAVVAMVDQVDDPPDDGGFLGFDPTDTPFSRGVAALVGWGLFLFSGGRMHDWEDLVAWLSEAGFEEFSHEGLTESPGFSLVVARK